MSNPLFHVIKDPIHGSMQFTAVENQWVKPFIDSANFQRLRHIKQLGLGDYIFPGAVHSRFNHCLGCAYIAGQIAQKIRLSDSERQLVMVASLLHDIGHGPFSHAFEDIYEQKIIRHEDWTPYFLADYTESSFLNRYNQLNPRHTLGASELSTIQQIIMHTLPNKSVLGDIVSSQLDADRLDYLLRDSHFCGVRYGEYDFRWMLHCLAIVKTQSGERLGITHKGIGVVEHYLMARRLMLNNIYRSHKKLAIEALLVHLLALLAKELDKEPLFKTIRASRLGRFLQAVQSFNESLIATGQDLKNVSRRKQQFLKENFSHYKNLCDYDVFLCIETLTACNTASSHPAIQLAKRLQQRIMPKIVRIENGRFQDAEAMITQFKRAHMKKYHDWQLMLIQTPHQSYSGEQDPILVYNEYGQVKPIHDYSLMLDAISDKYEHVAFLAIDKLIVDEPTVQKLQKTLASYQRVT